MSLVRSFVFKISSSNKLLNVLFLFPESLRKYPPLPFLDRRCDMDYKVPGTDLIIEKGTAVYIPVISIQTDEAYFTDSNKYDPDRFENNVNTGGLIHFPFGYGPRSCIGN